MAEDGPVRWARLLQKGRPSVLHSLEKSPGWPLRGLWESQAERDG